MITYPTITINLGGGEFVSFSRDQVISADVVEEISPVAVEMPSSQLEFRIRNTDGAFSMFNGAIYARLKDKLPVTVYENMNDEPVMVGVYYLTEWRNVSDEEIEFTAVDIIGVFAEMDFDGIFWESAVTLSQAMAQIFSPLGTAYLVDDDAASATVSGWIPPSTYRDALQQICFAAGAMALTARTDKLIVKHAQIPYAIRDWVITKKDAAQTSIDVIAGVAQIELVTHNYSRSGKQETIFDEYLEAGSHKVVFDNPYYNIEVQGAGYVPRLLITSGGDYIITSGDDNIVAGGEFTYGSNSVFIELESGSQITITGYAWLDSRRSIFYNSPDLNRSKKQKRYTISNATLVNANRAQSVLDSARDYYNLRYLQDITFLPSHIKPSDLVLSDTINAERVLGIVVKSSINLTGGFLSKSNLLGILPYYVKPENHPKRRPRTGVAITGADLTRNNKWRNYA